MAMTPEKRVKKVVREQLDALGAYHFMPATGGYGKSGVPDIVGCFRGKFFAIECKAGAGKTTPLQEKALKDIWAAGGIQAVVNEANMHEIGWLLGAPRKNPQQLEIDFGDDDDLT